jgi:type IV pilus assembly protein PilC
MALTKTTYGLNFQEMNAPEKVASGNQIDAYGADFLQSATDSGKKAKAVVQPVVHHPALYKAKVKKTDLILFTTQMSIMLESGVVLSEALDVVTNQISFGVFKAIITDVAESVRGGENLSRVLSKYPRVFDSMFISMVKASEASGKIAEMLNVLSGYLNFEHETRKRVKGALIYPCIMGAVAIIAAAILITFVLPRLIKVYALRGAELPKLTQILISITKAFMNPQSAMIIVSSFVLFLVALYSFAQSTFGRKVIDYLQIKIPVLGTMFVDRAVTRSMRIMATMVNTGVSIVDAIDIIKNSSTNSYFQKLWDMVDKRLHDGYQLSESIQIAQTGMKNLFGVSDRKMGDKLIDPGIIQMLRAGEKGGKIGDVSNKISIFYEKKLEASIKAVTTLIEPLMIIVLGSIIGTIAIALLLPVLSISKIIH